MAVALAGFAAGAAGPAVLAERDAHPTPVATGKPAQAVLTAVEDTKSTAVSKGTTSTSSGVAPEVVTLVDAPSIAVRAGLGNDFRVTLGGRRTMGNPAEGVDGQRITFTITQGSDGPHTVTWSDQYKFGIAGVPVLSTTVGRTDIIGFVYNHRLGGWLCVGVALGF